MDTLEEAHRASCRVGFWGAVSTLAGIVLSGPLAIAWLARTHPQPPWHDALTFARHYHPAQSFPYLAGLLLVGGYVVLLASIHQLAGAEQKATTASALAFSATFAALVFFNYIVQTTFLPSLVRPYLPENAALISALSMSNPQSLAWAIEMWAWGFLGVATWLAAPVFSRTLTERLTAITFVVNGIWSVAGAAVTAARPGWVMTTAGLVAFATWNLLVFAMSTLAALSLRARHRQLVRPLAPSAAPSTQGFSDAPPPAQISSC